MQKLLDSPEAETLLVEYMDVYKKAHATAMEGLNRARANLVGTHLGSVVTMSAYFGALFFLEGVAMVGVLLACTLLTLWWCGGKSAKEHAKHEQLDCEFEALKETMERIKREFYSLTGTEIVQTLNARYEEGKL